MALVSGLDSFNPLRSNIKDVDRIDQGALAYWLAENYADEIFLPADRTQAPQLIEKVCQELSIPLDLIQHKGLAWYLDLKKDKKSSVRGINFFNCVRSGLLFDRESSSHIGQAQEASREWRLVSRIGSVVLPISAASFVASIAFRGQDSLISTVSVASSALSFITAGLMWKFSQIKNTSFAQMAQSTRVQIVNEWCAATGAFKKLNLQHRGLGALSHAEMLPLGENGRPEPKQVEAFLEKATMANATGFDAGFIISLETDQPDQSGLKMTLHAIPPDQVSDDFLAERANRFRRTYSRGHNIRSFPFR